MYVMQNGLSDDTNESMFSGATELLKIVFFVQLSLTKAILYCFYLPVGG
jgi:hypothetical protein